MSTYWLDIELRRHRLEGAINTIKQDISQLTFEQLEELDMVLWSEQLNRMPSSDA